MKIDDLLLRDKKWNVIELKHDDSKKTKNKYDSFLHFIEDIDSFLWSRWFMVEVGQWSLVGRLENGLTVRGIEKSNWGGFEAVSWMCT